MLHLHKNYFFIFSFIFFSIFIRSDEDPYLFIDKNAQKMVQVLTNDSDLFELNRTVYEDKIKEIFEPMIDFRRVAASVMGKKYYLLASKNQRSEFVLIFKDSLILFVFQKLCICEHKLGAIFAVTEIQPCPP